MPTWSNAPPPVQKNLAFELRRTPPDRPLAGIVTCEDLVGCNTHFWGGRTVPCEDDGCRACADGMPYRWHAYVSVYIPSSREHILFECTAKAAIPFTEYRAAHGTLRGCNFQALRAKRAKNSKVSIATKPADLNKVSLPMPPDLVKALSVIWQLPAVAMPTSPGLDGHEQVRMDGEKVAAIRDGRPPARRSTRRADTDERSEEQRGRDAADNMETLGQVLAKTNGKPQKVPA